jgi:hypothetical protein
MIGRYWATPNKRFPAPSVRGSPRSAFINAPEIIASWERSAPNASIPTDRANGAGASPTRSPRRPTRSAAHGQPMPGSVASEPPVLTPPPRPLRSQT